MTSKTHWPVERTPKTHLQNASVIDPQMENLTVQLSFYRSDNSNEVNSKFVLPTFSFLFSCTFVCRLRFGVASASSSSAAAALGSHAHLGAVYKCDFPYESPYDSVYDLLPKVSSKLIFDFFLMKCVNKPLQWLTEK
jgi:hypothetical protein